MDQEYVSFNDALKELGIGENELRAMITRGQLRVFGKGGREMFRRSAIENLKKAGQTQPTIILPNQQEEPLPVVEDESPLGFGDGPAPLALDDDVPTEVPALTDEDDNAVTAETVMPTIELAPQGAGDEEHTDVATQEVSLADHDYLILEGDKSPAGAAQQPEAVAQAAEPVEEEVVYEEAAEGSGAMTALLGLLCIFMLLSTFIFFGATRNGLSDGLKENILSFAKSVGLG